MLDLHAANLRTVSRPILTAASTRRRMEVICAVIAHANGLRPDDITGRSRRKRVAEPRHDFMLAARDEGYTLESIGSYLGGRHHTTVLNGCREAEVRARRASESGKGWWA